MSRFSIISADSHICEPPNVWTDNIDPEYRDRAPRIQRIDDKDSFVADGQVFGNPAGTCRAGKPGDAISDKLEHVYPGAWDPDARIEAQLQDGVEAEVIYPTAALRTFSFKDTPYRQACIRAYNDWAHGFCSRHPDHHKGMALVDILDQDAAISEMRRAKKLGLVGVLIALASDDPRLYWDDRHDRFWAEAQDLEMPVALHVISNVNALPDFNDVMIETFVNVTAQQSFASMIWGGLFVRFPRLKIISAENEAGWVGLLLDKMDHLILREDRHFAHDHAIKKTGMMPSEYFRRNIALTFIWDRSAVAVREWIGLENLMWSNDYPHADSSWPDSARFRDHIFLGVPEHDRHLIQAENAARLFGFN